VENLRGRCVISKHVSLSDIVWGFGDRLAIQSISIHTACSRMDGRPFRLALRGMDGYGYGCVDANYRGIIQVILPLVASRVSAKLSSTSPSVLGNLISSSSLSVLLIYLLRSYDLTVCVMPIVLASRLARLSRTILPAVEKSLSTSTDIGREETISRAIHDSRGYSSCFSC
jgi:hypothetical protein